MPTNIHFWRKNNNVDSGLPSIYVPCYKPQGCFQKSCDFATGFVKKILSFKNRRPSMKVLNLFTCYALLEPLVKNRCFFFTSVANMMSSWKLRDEWKTSIFSGEKKLLLPIRDDESKKISNLRK